MYLAVRLPWLWVFWVYYTDYCFVFFLVPITPMFVWSVFGFGGGRVEGSSTICDEMLFHRKS